MLRSIPGLAVVLALGAALVQRTTPEPASLTVRLLDAQGRPWSAPRVRPLVESWSADRHDWPATPEVGAFACEASADGTPVAGAALRGETVRPAEVRFPLAPGARAWVHVLGPGFDGRARLVELPADGGPAEVEVRAEELGALATLTLHVTTEGREILGGQGYALELALESTDTGAPLLVFDAPLRLAPFVARAPAGRYRVVAAGQPSLDWHGRPLAARSLGRAEGEVELVAGEARELTLALGDLARLELTLHGEPDASDARAVSAWEPWPGPGLPALLTEDERVAARAQRAGLAELHLLRPARRAEPVVRGAEAFAGTSAAGTHLLDEWPLGATNTSEPLPSGRYTLLARLPGGREARVAVELVAGATTKATLRF